MIRIFNGNRAGVLLLIPFFIAFYIILNNYTQHFPVEASINLGFWGRADVLFPLLGQIASGAIVFVNALLINYIFNNNEFFDRNTYITSLTYVILMSFFHSFYFLDGMLLSHFFLLLVFQQIFYLNQNSDGKRNVFNAFFWAGLAATFHPPLLICLPILIVIMRIIRPFIFKEFLLLVVGYSIPLAYAFAFLWISEHKIHLKLFEQTTNYSAQQINFLITSVLFTLLFILGLISNRLKNKTSTIRLKKLTSILFWWLIAGIGLGLFDFLNYAQIERFSFVIFVLTIYLNFALNNKTFQFIANAMFYLTFAYSIVKFFISI
ncbi:MAG: hypothetical protein V4638_00520 [Bacteroidota bacterium]